MSRKFNVAVVGATGAVGEELFRILEEQNFPIGELLPLASARSVGTDIEFKGSSYPVVELTETVFQEHEVDIAFFSAGGSISEKFAKYAVEGGAVVIDNTSHFRMDPNVPLVVPEVNPEDIENWRESGIIANPNCSTIQMVQALKPLDDLYGIKIALNVIPQVDKAMPSGFTKEEEKMVYETQKNSSQRTCCCSNLCKSSSFKITL
jgi:aspartate-semialdehyde dehydrogenase